MPTGNLSQNAAALAAGGGVPPGPIPAQGAVAGGQGTTLAAPGSTVTTQISEILGVLKQILPQVVDERGYVNMDRLITLWPQFSQVPFQTVLQLIQQNPELLNELIAQFGLNGIIAQGRVIGADELATLGSRQGGV